MVAPILLSVLQKAIESGDQERIMKTAHKLNGVAANCGGERFFKAVLEIEKAAREDEFDAQIIDISFLEKELEYLTQALEETDWSMACKAIGR
jgi:HPt (histidine-containing phosphotransfer) domain-containing protein